MAVALQKAKSAYESTVLGRSEETTPNLNICKLQEIGHADH